MLSCKTDQIQLEKRSLEVEGKDGFAQEWEHKLLIIIMCALFSCSNDEGQQWGIGCDRILRRLVNINKILGVLVD